MAYQPETAIKARMRAAGITIRDLANVLDEPPGTVGNRLAGYIPLAQEQRERILKALDEAEAQQARELQEHAAHGQSLSSTR